MTTTMQTLADGMQITTHQGKQLEARDSAGRTRNEMYLPERPPGSHRDSDQPIFVTIVDPVAGHFIHLDPRQKTATVTRFSTMHAKQSGQKSPQMAPVQSLPRQEMPHSAIEKLGGETGHSHGTLMTANLVAHSDLRTYAGEGSGK